MRTRSTLALALAAGLCFSPAALSQEAEFVEHNGSLYRVLKSSVPGDESRVFIAVEGGPSAPRLTPGQLREHVAAQPARVISRALEEHLRAAPRGKAVSVLVTLRHQPAAPIARQVWAGVDAQAEAIAARVREITRRTLPGLVLPREAEAAAPVRALAPAEQAEKRAWSELHDDLYRDARREIYRRIEAAVAEDQRALAQSVAKLGGQVFATVPIANAAGARLNMDAIRALAADPLVASIDLDHAGAPELDNHQHSLGLVTGFWSVGITGGVHDVGVLDTGVQQSHPALATHTFLSNMGVADTDTHGTGMAGILASTSTQYPGVARGSDKIVVALAGGITTSMPGMNYIASTGEPENVNYSFGNGTASTNDYTQTDQFFDGVISTFRYMVSKSTGNGGYGSTTPTITYPAPAFNLLASANMDDFNTVTRADDRITSSSSRGPTPAGRKKPDITAPGNNSMSCTPSGTFGNIGGTSSASPHTGGGFVLVWDMGTMDVPAAKAVLLNTTDAITDAGTSTTADDVYVQGSLWNKRYGWGYLNLGQAYLHGLDAFSGSVPPAPENADYRLYAGPMFQHDRATLVWERVVAYNGATYPTQIESLSDLDLFAFRESDNGLVTSSTSAIDSVEQIGMPAAVPLVVLKVEASGAFDPQVATQSFGLATTEGFTARTGPVFSPTFSLPPSVPPGGQAQVTVHVLNSGDLAAHSVAVQLSGIGVVGGLNPQNLGTIGAGQTAPAVWTIEAPASPGAVQLDVSITSSSYGEAFAGNGSGSLNVGGAACYPNCDGSTAAPILNVADFTCFLAKYAAGDPAANCDGSTEAPTLNVGDFTCFLAKYAAGCL